MSNHTPGGTSRLRGRLFSRLSALALAGLIVATMVPNDAEARRMGGGRSFGRQSATVSQQYRAPSQMPRQTPSQPQYAPGAAAGTAGAAAAARPRNRWLGPLAGIAAGLGIGALLSHFGLGGAFAGALSNLIVIALLAFLAIWLIRKFTRRREPAYADAASRRSLDTGNTPYSARDSGTPYGGASYGGAAPAAGAAGYGAPAESARPWGVPADFDQEAFLRNAKVHFVRMQAAWDEGNLDDIREFTTPEMFADTRVELASRGTQANRTDVVQLDAVLLGIEDRGNEYLASVRFTGLIREERDQPAAPLDEVWNLSRSKTGNGGWLLAGIQQPDSPGMAG